MELTAEQKKQVSNWISEGFGLSDVQKRISEDFKITMTFMEVRFLVDDLDLDLQDDEPEVVEEPAPAAPKTPQGEAELVDDEVPSPFPGAEEVYQDPPGESVGGNVSVEVDALQRPGALVSGSVLFSDGVKANWQVDQMGRLGIIPPSEGYQPPEADLETFQLELQTALKSKGF